VPFAADIDWVVELSGVDCRQESRLQHLVDKPLTCARDDSKWAVRSVITTVASIDTKREPFIGSNVLPRKPLTRSVETQL
jgi:hypothetical protein